jgi:hypothetical protein
MTARSICGSDRRSPPTRLNRTGSRPWRTATFSALRLYGTGVEFFDQTWKPDDVVKVE